MAKKKKWIVDINIEGQEQETLELYDAHDTIGDYLHLMRNYFEDLLAAFPASSNYNVGKGIESVTGKDGEDWTKNPWLLIMLKEKEAGVPFWFLIKREDDLTGYIVALGPELFFKYAKSERDIDEKIRQILDYLINYQHKFNTIMLIPNYLQ